MNVIFTSLRITNTIYTASSIDKMRVYQIYNKLKNLTSYNCAVSKLGRYISNAEMLK